MSRPSLYVRGDATFISRVLAAAAIECVRDLTAYTKSTTRFVTGRLCSLAREVLKACDA